MNEVRVIQTCGKGEPFALVDMGDHRVTVSGPECEAIANRIARMRPAVVGVNEQADWRRAREIADSEAVLGVFASPEWDDLSDDGKAWVKAIVNETARRLASPPPQPSR